MSRGERKAMIGPGRPGLSLSRQCRLLSISRSSFYYAPIGESPENLALMRRIDELFLKYPFYGSRQMARQLWREGAAVGRHRVRRLDGCPCRKSNPNVLVMQSAEMRLCEDLSDALSCARNRRVLVQR